MRTLGAIFPAIRYNFCLYFASYFEKAGNDRWYQKFCAWAKSNNALIEWREGRGDFPNTKTAKLLVVLDPLFVPVCVIGGILLSFYLR